MKPEISIVIPAYNEEESLYPLFDELYPVMVGLERSFELIFINDGSKDKTLPILYDLYKSISQYICTSIAQRLQLTQMQEELIVQLHMDLYEAIYLKDSIKAEKTINKILEI